MTHRPVKMASSKFESLYESIMSGYTGTHGSRKFSCLMAKIPEPVAGEIRAIGLKIDPADLTGDGLDDEPHITIKWGIHTSDPEEAWDAVSHLVTSRGKNYEPYIELKIKSLSLFENENWDVLKFDIESSDLEKMNAAVQERLRTTDTFPDYHPHMTVAYLKSGTGKKYVEQTPLDGRDVEVRALHFSTADDEHFLKNI